MASTLGSLSDNTDETLQKIAYQDSFKDKSKKTAFIYRKDEIQKPIDFEFQQLVKKFIANKEAFIKRIIDSFKSSGMKIDEEAIKKCIEEETKYFNDIDLYIDDSLKLLIPKMAIVIKTEGIKNEVALIENLKKVIEEGQEGISDELMPLAHAYAFEKYFGLSYQDIDEGGMVYALPNGKHKWSYNASWLRGHFNKGTDTFVIKTPIDEASMYRGESSVHKGDIGSGFFREIATCCMLGYKLKIKDGQIVLHHNNPEELAGVTLQDIIGVSIDKMVPFYTKAIEEYNTLKRELEFASRISKVYSADTKHKNEEDIKKKTEIGKSRASASLEVIPPSLEQQSLNAVPFDSVPHAPILSQYSSQTSKTPSKPRPPITFTMGVVVSIEITADRAEQLRKALVEIGIPSHLIVRSYNQGEANSYQITVTSTEQEYIKKTRETMYAMSIGIQDATDVVRIDEGKSSSKP